jgi:putative sigma-54 modulation protein
VGKIEKYVENPREAHVVLSVEKFRHLAEITIIADGITLNSQGKNSDLYTAIDQMVEKMERQIHGRRGKVRRKRTNTPSRPTLVSGEGPLEGEEEEGEIPSSIQRRRVLTKPMSLEEAVAQLHLSRENVLFFIHSDSGQMNALYRNKEGEVEWVEPQKI